MDGSLVPPDLEELIAGNPNRFLIEMDRELVAEHGLSMFIRLAWPTIERVGTYKTNWHIDAICEYLQAVSAGHLKRLLISIPPRHMKSIAVAVMWAPWDWIEHPWRRFLFASYAHGLSTKDSTRCRRVIQSTWYQERWGDRFRLTEDQNTKIKFENDHNGSRQATSVNGQVTGDGGDIVVADDPNNAKKAESEPVREATNTWWDESMSSRLNDQETGAFVVIQQRLHANDVTGHILSREADEYEYLCLPAEYDPKHPHVWVRDPRTEVGQLLWPAHVGAGSLANLKKRLGPYAAAGQLQQLPAPREGGIFKRGWFDIVATVPEDCVWARGWDFAATEAKITKVDPDWTATALIGWSNATQRWYIRRIQRWREDPHEVERLLVATSEADPKGTLVRIPQDPAAAGKSVAQRMLVLLSKFSVTAESVSGDKVTRAMAWAGKAAGGLIKLVKDRPDEEPWNEAFLTEIAGFPNFAHDDQVDCVGSAFEVLSNNTFGIMEWARRQAEAASGQAEAERKMKEAVAAAGPLVYEGNSAGVRQPTMEEYARALAGKKEG